MKPANLKTGCHADPDGRVLIGEEPLLYEQRHPVELTDVKVEKWVLRFYSTPSTHGDSIFAVI